MRYLQLLTVCLLIIALPLIGCSKTEKQSPTQVVQAFQDYMELLKAQASRSEGEHMTEEQAKQFFEDTKSLTKLFIDEGTAKPLFGAWLLFNVESFEITGETIEGDKATVTAMVKISGLGGINLDAANKQKPQEQAFQLEKVDGAWRIADIDGVIAKNPLRGFLR